MRQFTAVLLAVCFVPALAQQQPKVPKPTHRAPTTVDTKAPVTKAEARAVFSRAANALAPVLHVKFGASMIPDSSAAVTRAEVVAEMHRIFMTAQPKFKFTPRKTSYQANRLTLKDSRVRPMLEKLIAYGAVAKVGPVAAGTGATLSVHQFGDAVGFFVARIADLTHLPSSRWTPELHD